MAKKAQAEKPPAEPAPAKVPANPCREVSHLTLRSLLDLMAEAAEDGRIALADAERIATAILAPDGLMEAHYETALKRCHELLEAAELRAQRKDLACRVVVQPFRHLFDDPESDITRYILVQFRAALKMILGEPTLDALQAACREVADELGVDAGGDEEWYAFYDDARCRAVVEQILVAIAESFKRFDTRLEWFLTLMNTDHATESLGSRAFVQRERDTENPVNFRRLHFHLLFSALFAGIHPGDYNSAETVQFNGRHGRTPEEAFGPFLKALGELAED